MENGKLETNNEILSLKIILKARNKEIAELRKGLRLGIEEFNKLKEEYWGLQLRVEELEGAVR